MLMSLLSGTGQNLLELIDTVTDATDLDSPEGMAANGDYLYVSQIGNDDGIASVSIVDPTNLTIDDVLKNNTYFTNIETIVALGNYLYAPGNNYMNVVDISNPSSMSIAGSVLTSGLNPRDMDLQGGYAYVTDFNGYLRVYDITNPAAPTLAGSVTSTQLANAHGVCVSGDYAYVSTNSNPGYVCVIDITNPASPSQAGYVTSAQMNAMRHLCVRGDYLFCASSGDDALCVVDVSTPSSPSQAGFLIDSTNLNGIYGIELTDRHLYAVGYQQDTLVKINVESPTSPQIEQVLTTGDGPQDVEVYGNYVYVSSRQDHSVRVYRHVKHSLSALLDTLSSATYMDAACIPALGYKVLYVTGGSYLSSVDITDPENLAFLDNYDRAGSVTAGGPMVLNGSYLYVLDELNTTLDVFDISDPTSLGAAVESLVDATNFDLGTTPSNLVVQGNYLYVGGSDRLVAVDISNPLSISVADVIVTGDWSYCRDLRWLTIDGNYLFAANNTDDGVAVFDISTPTVLASGAFLSGTSQTTCTALYRYNGSTGYVYAIDGSKVYIFKDNTLPSLTEVTSFDVGTAVTKVFGLGEFLYVTTAGNLRVYDASSRDSAPSLVSNVSMGSNIFAGNAFLSERKGMLVAYGSPSDEAVSLIDIA